MEKPFKGIDANKKYIAWVPCISGRLLFRYFSSGHPRATDTILIKHRESLRSHSRTIRTVVLSEILDLKDEKNRRADGRFRVTLAGSRFSDEDNFIGKVYVLPAEVSKENVTWGSILNELRAIASRASNEEHIDSYFKTVVERLDQFKHDEYHIVRFDVDECGFTELVYEPVGISSDSLDRCNAPIITRQCFYYLKYSLHKHQHHQRDDDSLTTVHECPKDLEKVGAILINDLLASIVDLKRKFDELDSEGLYEARGVAAYTQSLIESCQKKGFLTSQEYQRQKNYFFNLSSSLKITAEKKQRRGMEIANAWATARSILLFFISIIAPVMFLFRAKIVNGINGASGSTSDLIAAPFVWTFSYLSNALIVLGAVILLFLGYLVAKTRFTSSLLRFSFYRALFYRVIDSPNTSRRLAWLAVVGCCVLIPWTLNELGLINVKSFLLLLVGYVFR